MGLAQPLLVISDLQHVSWQSSPVSIDLLSRHALPLFTSLLNVVCAYDPVGYGIPYNYLLSSDQREQLVVQAIQVLIVTLEHEGGSIARAALQVLEGTAPTAAVGEQVRKADQCFYLSHYGNWDYTYFYST